MDRVNILWALPVVLILVPVAMMRLVWAMLGLPWEPDEGMGVFAVLCGIILGVISALVVGIMQAEGSGIWWTVKKKEKSDERPS